MSIPISIPAPTIIENREKFENLGVSPGRQSKSLPELGTKANNKQTTIYRVKTKIYQVAKLLNRNEFKALKTLLAFSGKTTAHIINTLNNIVALMVKSLLNPE